MNKISHEKAQSLLQWSMDGDLSLSKKGMLENHLSKCAECRWYAKGINGLLADLQQVLHQRWDGKRANINLSKIVKDSRRKIMVKHSLSVVGAILVMAAFTFSISFLANLASHPLQPASNPAINPKTEISPSVVSTKTVLPTSTSTPVPTGILTNNHVITGSGDCRLGNTTDLTESLSPIMFQWPSENHFLSGQDYSPDHPGIDISGLPQDSVNASAGGTVIFAGETDSDYGLTVIIHHSSEFQTVYAHLGSINVHCEQQVMEGDEIGTVALLENNQEYLHFEIRFRGQPTDPWFYLPPP